MGTGELILETHEELKFGIKTSEKGALVLKEILGTELKTVKEMPSLVKWRGKGFRRMARGEVLFC